MKKTPKWIQALRDNPPIVTFRGKGWTKTSDDRYKNTPDAFHKTWKDKI